MQCFGHVYSVHFQALMMKKQSYKDYTKGITTRDNGGIKSHDQDEIKMNSTIITMMVYLSLLTDSLSALLKPFHSQR